MSNYKSHQSEPDALGIHRVIPRPECTLANGTKTPYATHHVSGQKPGREKTHAIKTPHQLLMGEFKACNTRLGLPWVKKGAKA